MSDFHVVRTKVWRSSLLSNNGLHLAEGDSVHGSSDETGSWNLLVQKAFISILQEKSNYEIMISLMPYFITLACIAYMIEIT